MASRHWYTITTTHTHTHTTTTAHTHTHTCALGTAQSAEAVAWFVCAGGRRCGIARARLLRARARRPTSPSPAWWLGAHALLPLSPAPAAGLADGLVVRLHRYDDIKHEKLFDNSYETHSSLTGESYGGKAAEVLIKTQGKSFRHEKTKKKRGTYRGGQISMASNSIKFED